MASSTDSARHRASRRGHPLSLLLTASAVAAAIVGAVVVSGGTYALWSKTAPGPVLSVASGKLEFVASSSFDATLWGKMIPGESVRQPFTVVNSGDVNTALSATAVAGTGFEVRVASGTCPTSAIGGTAASVSATSLGTVAKGATSTMCLQVTLTTAATAGQSVAFSVSLTGTQA